MKIKKRNLLIPNPIRRAPQYAPQKQTLPVVTTQATGKDWKAMQILGLFAVIVGFAVLPITTWEDQGVMRIFPLLAGIAAYIGARIGAWWHHG